MLPSEIIASYMMSQFLVMVMQVTLTLHCKPVDSYNNDNIGQAAITLITVFVVFQIPCQGPIAWLVVLTLLQGDKCKMFFCTIVQLGALHLEERGWVSVHLKEG